MTAEYVIHLRDTNDHEHQAHMVNSEAKRLSVKAGRRSGKTVGFAIRAVKRFLQGRRQLYAAPTSEQTDTFWSEVCRALREPIEAGIFRKNETERFIELPGTKQRIKAKAQPLTVKIYTPDGYKLMGDIRVGDEVLTPFGSVTKVIGVYPQGVQDIYEITFGDGCKTECTLDHLWSVQNFKASVNGYNHFEVVTTKQLLNHRKVNRDRSGISRRPCIRISESVAYRDRPVPVEPYLLGALIGDGTLSKDCSPRITTADVELLDKIKKLLPDGVSIQYAGKYDYRLAPNDKPRKNKNPLLTGLKLLGLIGKRSHEKFIPDCYKYNSENVRIKLIQGILDTDGTVSGNGRAMITQTSKQLAADIAEVIQSLGGLCSTKKQSAGYKSASGYHKCQPVYRQYITYDGVNTLFTLQRKRDKHKPQTFKNSNINRSIRTIKLVKKEHAQCIMVEDSRQLYLTDSFIVTHNTAWNANTLRGDYADDLYLDEFQLMAEDTWDEVGAPMLADNNGDAVLIFTPPSLKSAGVSKARDPRHASKMFKKALEDKSGLWEAIHFTSLDNPFISKEGLAIIANDMSIDSYRREILAEDDEIEQSWLVYGCFQTRTQVIPRFPIPKEWPVYSWHDFGSANPAALFVAQNPGTGDMFIYQEYLPGGGRSIANHVEQFQEITKGYNVLRRVGGNVTTEDEIRQGYSAHGWPITAPRLSKVNAQIDRVLSLFGLNKVFIFRDLYNLLAEISNCMWKLDADNHPTNEIADERRYHLLACVRYGASEIVPETVKTGKPAPAVNY